MILLPEVYVIVVSAQRSGAVQFSGNIPTILFLSFLEVCSRRVLRSYELTIGKVIVYFSRAVSILMY